MDPEHCVDSASPEATRALGERLGELLEGGDVVALSGELGAGKTCLVQGLALGLGVDPAVQVTSPTFTLVGEYPGRLILRHADFYRVEGYDRLLAAGFDDLLDRHGVLVVEWPERVPEALPEERLEVRMEILPGAGADPGERPRRICLGGRGLRAREIRKKVLASCP
jgi:tRNA threonylcarbamoyladenosine biosynthesis protein TsaE